MRFLKNKFFIVTALFLVWIIFFAEFDLMTFNKQREELKEMKEKIEYLTKEVEKLHKEKVGLKTDSSMIEKYAREKYFMKKSNEDVYMIDTVSK